MFTIHRSVEIKLYVSRLSSVGWSKMGDRWVGVIVVLDCPYVFRKHNLFALNKYFSTHFQWANDVASQLCAVHSEEVARRKVFQSQFEGHFLSSLFRGLEDSPPPFATQAPPLFDSELPKVIDNNNNYYYCYTNRRIFCSHSNFL